MKTGIFASYLITFIVVCRKQWCDGEEFPGYNHITVADGDHVRLNCTLGAEVGTWTSYIDGKSKEISSAGMGILVDKDKFRLFGGNNLEILNVNPSDAGKYHCFDEDNDGFKYILSILASNLTCSDKDIDQKFCGSFRSLVINCTISYYGETLLNITWRRRYGSSDEKINENDGNINNSNPRVIWSTLVVHENESLAGLTVFASVEELTSPSDLYQWISPQYQKYCVGNNPTTGHTNKISVENTPDYSTYRPAVFKNSLPEEKGNFSDVTKNASEIANGNWSEEKNEFPIWGIILICLIPLILVGAIAFSVRYFKRRRRRKYTPRPPDCLPLIQRNPQKCMSIEPLIIRGITMLRDKIYLVFQEQRIIRVVNNVEEFEIEKDIEVSSIEDPWHLEANDADGCLYIADKKLNCIWIVRVETGKKSSKVNSANKEEPQRICGLSKPHKFSVMADGRVLIPIWPKELQIRNFNRPTLTWDVEKTIPLPEEMQEPYYALKTNKKTFIVAYGHEERERHRVGKIEVSKETRAVWSYPSNEQDQIENIDLLAIDKSGRIFVNDQNNGRILLLNECGNKICQVSTERFSYRLCYAKKKNQLLVGHYGSVSIYIPTIKEDGNSLTAEIVLQKTVVSESLNDLVPGPIISDQSWQLRESYKKEVEGKTVRGMTEMNNQLYLIFKECNYISAYDLISGSQLGKIENTDLKHPWFIDSCAVNNCFYVTSKRRENVIKLQGNLQAQVWQALVWDLKLEKPYRLSVISEGRVLIPEWAKSPALNIYDSNGIIAQIISLRQDIVEPYHAVEIQHGCEKAFLVGHGDKRSSHHRVCKVNGNLETLWTYGGLRGFRGELNRPRNLATDEEGRVYIADEGNKRIVVLDANGRFLTNRKTDTRPERLLYSKSSRQILFGHVGIIFGFKIVENSRPTVPEESTSDST